MNYSEDYLVDEIGIWKKLPNDVLMYGTVTKITGNSQYELFLPKKVFEEAYDEYIANRTLNSILNDCVNDIKEND